MVAETGPLVPEKEPDPPGRRLGVLIWKWVESLPCLGGGGLVSALDPQTVGGKRGGREALGCLLPPRSRQGLLLCPLGSGGTTASRTPNGRCGVRFLALPEAAVPGLTTRGGLSPLCSAWQLEEGGDPVVILGVPLPLFRRAPYSLSLQPTV